MKKFWMGILTAAVALSVAACTPTAQKTESQAQTTADAPQESASGEEMVPSTTGGASDKVPDPDVAPVAIVSIYHGSDESDGVTQDMDSLSGEEMDAQELVDKLVEYGVLTEGTKVIKFEKTDDTATLDLSEAKSGEGCSDKMFLAEIGNTFIDNYELESLKLLVNGANYSGSDIQQSDADVLVYESDLDTLS